MEVAELIEPDRVIVGMAVAGKSELLSELASVSSRYIGIPVHSILEALIRRESFGSTGIGRGVAIPHSAIKSRRMRRMRFCGRD
jgi:PTS system nitrogen regulatory IIA component